MKTKIAVAFAMLLPVSMAFADTQPTTTTVQTKPAVHQQDWKNKHFEKLSKELNLTDEQKASFAKIHEEGRAETDAKIKALLTPEQNKKFEEMKSKKHERFQHGDKAVKPAE